jgi:hypothetical protein
MPIKIDKLIAYKIVTNCPGKTLKRPMVCLTETGMEYGHMLCNMERLVGGDPAKEKWLGLKKTLEEFGYIETKKRVTPPGQS